MAYLGELYALCTALCWTGSSFAFAVASRAAGPLPANQFRLLAALPVLLLLGWLLLGSPWPTAAGGERLLLLAASGLVGLLLGDLGLFYALAMIGPRLSSVVMATWPGLAVAIGAAAGQPVGAGVLPGMVVTTVGVLLVLLRHPEGGAWRADLTRRQRGLGLAGALLGALGQAGGAVLARLGMAAGADLPDGVPTLQATVVRLVTAVVALQVVLLASGRPFAARAVFGRPPALTAALAGALCGPVGGVWLSMLALSHATNLGVAEALMATTPVFMMPLARWTYGARIGLGGVVGTLLVVAGVALLLLLRAS